MTKHSYAAKALSLLLALMLTLSLAVAPASASAVSYQDMNPKDNALLGTKFSVDATIIRKNHFYNTGESEP